MRKKPRKLGICECGCAKEIQLVDKNGRDIRFKQGHGGRKYSEPKEYKRKYDREHKKEKRAKSKIRCIAKKIKLIIATGGKCSNKKCGIEYDGKNAMIFDFHHKKKDLKEFDICEGIRNKGWKRVMKEVKKTILLCRNCHRIKHMGEF